MAVENIIEDYEVKLRVESKAKDYSRIKDSFNSFILLFIREEA